jgi:hypothetical protein
MPSITKNLETNLKIESTGNEEEEKKIYLV